MYLSTQVQQILCTWTHPMILVKQSRFSNPRLGFGHLPHGVVVVAGWDTIFEDNDLPEGRSLSVQQ